MLPPILFLLFLYLPLLPQVHSQTPAPTMPAKQSSPPEELSSVRGKRIFLISGAQTDSATHNFFFATPIPSSVNTTHYPVYFNQTLVQSPGSEDIITIDRIVYEPALFDDTVVLFAIFTSFNKLPGLTTVYISLTDPFTKALMAFDITYHVIGLVLYSRQPISHTSPTSNSLIRYTGLGSAQLELDKWKEENGQERQNKSVKARFYAGNDVYVLPALLDREKLILRVRDSTGRESKLLPWNVTQCSPTVKILGNRCSMGFSEDFDLFTVHVVEGSKLIGTVRVDIEWVGLKDFADFSGDEQSGTLGDNDEVVPPPVTSDLLTFVIVKGDDSVGLKGWQIIVIVIVCVLVIAAVGVLCMCCFCVGKTRDGKPRGFVKRLQGKLGTVGWPVRMKIGQSKFDVEEPDSSPEDSGVLMLEGSTGTRGKKGAEKLVLPREVTRGIDLEPSDGGSYRFPFSEDDCVGECPDMELDGGGGGITSVPGEMYEEMEQEEKEKEGRIHQEQEQKQVSVVEEDGDSGEWESGLSNGIGVDTTIDRSGVGAAIHRVRVVDLLHGPLSKGVVVYGGDGTAEQGGGDCSLSISTVS